jgi:hypothetical protein
MNVTKQKAAKRIWDQSILISAAKILLWGEMKGKCYSEGCVNNRYFIVNLMKCFFMFTEFKKIQLINDMMLVQDVDILNRIDAILKQDRKVLKRKKKSAQSFTGIISKKDALMMTKAIEEGCEQIDADGWN